MDGYTTTQFRQMYRAYKQRHGKAHPESSIDTVAFEKRLRSFESVIDPWVFGEGSKETSIRKWCDDNGMSTASGRRSFAVLFNLVDQIHAIS